MENQIKLISCMIWIVLELRMDDNDQYYMYGSRIQSSHATVGGGREEGRRSLMISIVYTTTTSYVIRVDLVRFNSVLMV